MKTEAIKQQILANYKQVSKLAHVQKEPGNLIPIWGLIYKHNRASGFVSQIGLIECNRSKIEIKNESEIELKKKFPFSSWQRTLKNINTMLQNIIANIDNENIVTKKIVSIFCFSIGQAEKLSKLSKQ